MKQKFSIKWIGSKQPRKQRKYRANAPLHLKHKMMSGNLSKELRKRYGKRSIPVRKGDNIKIMVGEFKGKTGKIDTVENKKMRITIDGIFRSKKDGTKVGVYFHPSNLQIKELNLDDSKRNKVLDRKASEKEEKKAETKEKTKEVKNEDVEVKNKSKEDKK